MTLSEMSIALVDMSKRDLEYLEDRIKAQLEAIKLAEMSQIKVGDRVRFVSVRPKYLIGEVVTVTKVGNSSLTVDGSVLGPRFRDQLKIKKSWVEVVR